MPRARSLVSVFEPQSRMMRSAAGFDTTVASTVSAQSPIYGCAERELRAVEVDVVAGTQLGHALLAGAEAQRRRRADRQLLEGDACSARLLTRRPIRISASRAAIAAKPRLPFVAL